MNEQHTAVNISKKLLAIFEEFGIASKIWMLLTDGAKNMIKLEKVPTHNVNMLFREP